MKYVFLAMFVCIMISIGIYSRKKINSVQDFLLGGRKMGPWITAFAYGTTYFSAVIFVGYAGRIGWNFGLSSMWIGIGNAVVGSLLAWLVLAKRTRKMTHELNASTMPEFFEKRYGSKSMKVFSAFIIFIFLLPYSASVYQGLGYLFEKVFGIPFIYCMFAMAVLTGLYLTLGGYIATAINDFVQGIIMLAGVFLMIYFVVSNEAVGGLSQGIQKLSQISGNGRTLADFFGMLPLSLLSLVILTSLGTWGLPQMVHKFYAIKDEKSIKYATVVSTIFALIVACSAYFMGSFGRLFLGNTIPSGSNGKPNLDMVMPLLFQKALPESLMGILVILILSASMSTLSALVLISSSAISIDLIKGVFIPDLDKKKTMFIMRTLCCVFVLLSFVIAVTPNSILTLMSFSWGTVSGCFLAPFIYGLYWSKTTKAGAWAGFIAGLGCSVVGVLIYGLNASMAPNLGVVSMLASLVAVPFVSLIDIKINAHNISTAAAKQEDSSVA